MKEVERMPGFCNEDCQISSRTIAQECLQKKSNLKIRGFGHSCPMIVITGAAGFIGSCLVRHFNDLGFDDLLLSDDFGRADKMANLAGKKRRRQIHRSELFEWLELQARHVEFVFHLGARTDTTEMNPAVFDDLNLDFSKTMWQFCTRHGIPLVYASSAATYGAGELGYADDHELPFRLRPLNPYGVSKNDFDKWALTQTDAPPRWAGLKFFNVYGPNEYHKGRMASVIFHTSRQIEATGAMKLFRSHRPDFRDGEQRRDFVYVKDVVEVCRFFFEKKPANGLYNLGTGQARTFWDLANGTFRALGREPAISFIETPADIRDNYQYFTEADMRKLRAAGFQKPFFSLEAGIADYVGKYLASKTYW
jgi:ADP-L-glycero-D-manno-heptose 6-epimerase